MHHFETNVVKSEVQFLHLKCYETTQKEVSETFGDRRQTEGLTSRNLSQSVCWGKKVIRMQLLFDLGARLRASALPTENKPVHPNIILLTGNNILSDKQACCAAAYTNKNNVW